MASYPTFDPNRYNDYKPEMYNLNPAVGKLYEPGSTFKIVTISAGLQSGAFTAETQVDDPGVIDRYDTPLSNFDSRWAWADHARAMCCTTPAMSGRCCSTRSPAPSVLQDGRGLWLWQAHRRRSGRRERWDRP